MNIFRVSKGLDPYSKSFFNYSSIGAMIMLAFTYWVVPIVGHYISLISTTFFAFYLIRYYNKYELSIQEYNIYYEHSIYIEIVITSIAMCYVHTDWMLFVPVMLGIMYFNVNAILKVQRIYIIASLFMLTPIIKIVLEHNEDAMEYSGVIVLFLLVIAISDMLFRSTAQAKIESDRRREMMKTVFQQHSSSTSHDIRNICCRMQSLALPKYRTNTQLFMTTLESYLSQLDEIITNNNTNNPEHFELSDLFANMIYDNKLVNLTLNLNGNSVVGVKRMIFSAIKNSIDNAIEASTRKNRVANISVTYIGNELSIVDDCGGFDISKIQLGNTSKKDKKGHGIFLRNFIDSSFTGIFGFKMDLERLPNGTKVIINLNEKMETF